LRAIARHTRERRPAEASVTAFSSARIVYRSVLFWIGAAFAATGMLLLALDFKFIVDETTFQRLAVVADGRITGRDIRLASAGNRQSTEYLLKYTFTTAGNVPVRGESEVTIEQWEASRKGNPLPIYYLPSRPDKNRLSAAGHWEIAMILTTLGVILGGLGGIFVGLQVHRWRLVTRLERDGASAQGTLTRVASGGTYVNRVRQWRLFYSFTDASGHRREGVSDWISPQEAKRWKKGATGMVRYDARDPRRSIWVAAEPPGPDR
jgi:hypothetical protein